MCPNTVHPSRFVYDHFISALISTAPISLHCLVSCLSMSPMLLADVAFMISFLVSFLLLMTPPPSPTHAKWRSFSLQSHSYTGRLWYVNACGQGFRVPTI